MEKSPNFDVEMEAIDDLVGILRRENLPAGTIEQILRCASWVCDARLLKTQAVVASECMKALEGTIEPDVAFDRILVRFRILDRETHVSPDEAELMRQYREAGYSVRKICAIFDRSTETVHRTTTGVEILSKQTRETPSPSLEKIYGVPSKFFSSPARERSKT